MIKANRTFWGVRFFDFYTKIGLHHNFRNVKIIGDYKERGRAVLLISNHFSWWDGFIQCWLNKQVFGRQFHVIMIEEQLRKFMILNKAGAFSVQKNSRDMIESLQYTTQLLSQKQNLVLIFPQGEIQSLYTQNFVFERGIEYILKRSQGNVDLIFNINLVDYFSFKKPSLNIYFKQYDFDTNNVTIKDIEQDFNNFARQCMNQQTER